MSSHTLACRMRPMTTRRRAAHLSILSILFWGIGCAVLTGVYDERTHTTLTELKAAAVPLVESFDVKPYAENKDAIEALTVKFQEAYEYERDKGEANSDTAKQFKKLNDLFAETVKDYQEEGPATLGPKYFKEAATVLGQALDIAIKTENEKKKNSTGDTP